MKTTTKIIAAAAATLSLALAGAVYAHPGGFGMGSMGWGPGAGHMGGGPGMGGWGPGSGGGWGPGMGPGMGRGPGMGPGIGMGMGPGMGPGFDMAAGAAARLAQVKSVLKITPAQETAWKAYEGAITQQASAMQVMRDQFHAQWQNTKPGEAAPDMAAQHQAMIALREANVTAHNAALKDLYMALTPEQRAIADRTLSFPRAQRGPGRAPNR